jgi:hypothetical protein
MKINLLLGALLIMSSTFCSPATAGDVAWHASLAAYPAAQIIVRDTQSGTLFYVESDGKSVVAIKGDKALWKARVIQEGDCTSGFPVIRGLRIIVQGKLSVTFCKHSFGEIDLSSGEYRFLGEG